VGNAVSNVTDTMGED